MLCIQKCAVSPMSLHIAAFDISQGQNWCCVFKKVQYRPMSLHTAASAISQGPSWCCIVKMVQYNDDACNNNNNNNEVNMTRMSD